jgi:hypothetical protein
VPRSKLPSLVTKNLPFCPIALLLIQENDVYWKMVLNAALLPCLKNKKTRNYPSDSHLSQYCFKEF